MVNANIKLCVQPRSPPLLECDYLTRVPFIPEQKRLGGADEDGGDESEEEESDEDDYDFDDDDEEEVDDSCPPGCDIGLYEKVGNRGGQFGVLLTRFLRFSCKSLLS